MAQNKYKKAQDDYFDRYIVDKIEKRRWMILSFILGGVVFLFCVLFIILLPLKTVVPYIVKVNSLGKTQAIKIIKIKYSPAAAAKEYFASRWVRDAFEIGPSGEHLKKRFVRAYSFLTPKALQFYKRYLTSNHNPFDYRKSHPGRQIHYEIIGISFISDLVLQVQTKKNIISSSGKLLKSYYVDFILKLKIVPPTSQAVILHNPLGIYINSYTVNKQIS